MLYTKRMVLAAFLLIHCFHSFAQNYRRDSLCNPDTMHVNHLSIKTGKRAQYDLIQCNHVSRIGLRIDVGFNTYAYNSKTNSWLGNHNGPLFGLSVSYRDLNIRVALKPATVNPATELTFEEGGVLTKEADLNPIKADYSISYSLNLAHNFSIEPYAALTTNSFLVINEEELNNHYNIPRTSGLTLGTTVNKYIRFKKEFEFLAIFARYGYGFSNYKKVNNSLGAGYSDLSFGVGYKGFFTRKLYKRV